MYRDFCCRHARALGLVGAVRNLPDGTVSVVAEGPRAALDAFALRLWKGPFLARVDMVKPRFSAATGEFRKFRIDYA